jgi:SAM-dependent methyltransferase
MSRSSEIRRAYDGSTLSYRVLKANGWGPLANLGFYTLPSLPLLVGGLGFFQRRLARKVLDLLDPQPGEMILDAAAGGGWTTDQIGRRGATAIGLDLLSAHVEAARERYARPGRVLFEVADVTRLPDAVEGIELGADSVDRVLCLEAAFHFGAKGRRDFLGDAFRVLRPGGRLVLVDFTWDSPRPEEIAELDADGLVRELWQFDEFEPLERYRRTAAELGFRELETIDWSRQVTLRFGRLCLLMAQISYTRPGRFLFCLANPSLFRLWNTMDWDGQLALMRAHLEVQRASKYMAMVFEKPGG